MEKFKLVTDYKMTGDQPMAVEKLTAGLKAGKKTQTLLGVTGSGKTFTIANVIERVQRPTLVISHNKTLAAQLYGEFKAFFPNNAVEYFVSYYDYYQPEAYVPTTDTYIDKDSDINDEIDKLRHSATASLSERNDVLIVASVSCIYGLGSPIDYKTQVLSLREKQEVSRSDIIKKLVDIQYDRNEIAFERGTFRAKGDLIDIYPASAESAVRIELSFDEIESIKEINPITGEIITKRKHIAIFPASYYVTPKNRMEKAIVNIDMELRERIKFFEKENKFLEKQRIEERTRYDIEMLKEIGRCKGIENYSWHLSGLKEKQRPYTLIDYFPDNFLTIIDESHVMLPQLRAMYKGDRSRKTSLVDYGFRLPSALDNRPLQFDEFNQLTGQKVFISATPAEYELKESDGISAELVIRPTGLIDPPIDIRKTDGQIDDLISEINKEVKKKGRVFITTLTKKMAEELTNFLDKANIKVKYMHSDIETLEREEILRDLRLGSFDVLVGINLLREGLDVPEVTLVAILDADKQGFLRTETSLVQTIGRAARNEEGRVIMYADRISPAMKFAIKETNRRRKKQKEYNKKNNITPTTIKKNIREITRVTEEVSDVEKKEFYDEAGKAELTLNEKSKYIKLLEKEMKKEADAYNFEKAAIIRDRIFDLKK
ncbi:MAG: excinuclease ABC subunit UvrB [Clostridiales Family XIII bacterium]|jgi:excinuclease ABC subunit B|nr:excinuclease ABC subunit UvrB [Clostridiales Family XIII bacterium]